jgi:hypothetical protein
LRGKRREGIAGSVKEPGRYDEKVFAHECMMEEWSWEKVRADYTFLKRSSESDRITRCKKKKAFIELDDLAIREALLFLA